MPRTYYRCDVTRDPFRVVAKFARKVGGSEFGVGARALMRALREALDEERAVDPVATPQTSEALADWIFTRLSTREGATGRVVSVEVLDTRFNNGVEIQADLP